MLATLGDEPFDHKDWLYEIKWDGYRAIAELSGNDVKVYSRNGISFLQLYPEISEGLARLRLDAVLDGEIVMLDKTGKSNFQYLQHLGDEDGSLVYYVFDILRLKGKDLTKLPLIERKKQLSKLLTKSAGNIRYSDHVLESGKSLFKAATKKNLEGIIAKKIDSRYLTGIRTKEWLKIKHHNTEEAVIAGYTAPRGNRQHIGALILGMHTKGGWKYVGHTGTGFTQQILKELFNKLKSYVRKTSPFRENIKVNDTVTWVDPVLVCNVKFTEKTRDGMLRHPVFQGLRIDKTAGETGQTGH